MQSAFSFFFTFPPVCTSQSAEWIAACGKEGEKIAAARYLLFVPIDSFFPAPRKLPYFFPRSCRSPFARSRVFRSAVNFLSLSFPLADSGREKRGTRMCERGREVRRRRSLLFAFFPPSGSTCSKEIKGNIHLAGLVQSFVAAASSPRELQSVSGKFSRLRDAKEN